MIDKALERGYIGSIGPIAVDYFRDELVRFREVIGSTSFSLEQKDLAFHAVGLLWVNLNQNDPKIAIAEGWWRSTAQEWMMRRLWATK